MVDKGLIACVAIGLLLGAIFASMYYVSSYNNAIQQRNELAQDLCNVEYERDNLRSESISTKSELKNARDEHDRMLDDYQEKERILDGTLRSLSKVEESYELLSYESELLYQNYETLAQQHVVLKSHYDNQTTATRNANTVISEQNLQLSRVSGLMQESYHRGYVDGSSSNSEDSSSIWDLIGLIALI